MSNTDTMVLQSGIGPLPGPATVDAGAALGTTPVLVVVADYTAVGGGRPRIRKVRIVNPNATNTLAWAVVPRGSAAPTFVATFGATAGVHVLARQVMEFSIGTDEDLYIVADAITQSFAVASWLF